jgi:uncharacterized membrane protein
MVFLSYLILQKAAFNNDDNNNNSSKYALLLFVFVIVISLPMIAQAQQIDNITSSNTTFVLPTTNAANATNATSSAAVVSISETDARTTTIIVSMTQGAQSPNNSEFFVPKNISCDTST